MRRDDRIVNGRAQAWSIKNLDRGAAPLARFSVLVKGFIRLPSPPNKFGRRGEPELIETWKSEKKYHDRQVSIPRVKLNF